MLGLIFDESNQTAFLVQQSFLFLVVLLVPIVLLVVLLILQLISSGLAYRSLMIVTWSNTRILWCSWEYLIHHCELLSEITCCQLAMRTNFIFDVKKSHVQFENFSSNWDQDYISGFFFQCLVLTQLLTKASCKAELLCAGSSPAVPKTSSALTSNSNWTEPSCSLLLALIAIFFPDCARDTSTHRTYLALRGCVSKELRNSAVLLCPSCISF